MDGFRQAPEALTETQKVSNQAADGSWSLLRTRNNFV